MNLSQRNLFSQPRRHYLADKFGQLANIFAGTLVIGQFLAPERVDLFSLGIGVLGTVGFYCAGFLLEEEKGFNNNEI